MKIALAGYRAAGKSTLGRVLARRRGWPIVDVDRKIEEKTGRQLSELYLKLGEAEFRPIESEVISSICAGDEDRIISLSAGSLIRMENWAVIKDATVVVYLQAAPEVLWQRISADPASADTRPKLTTGGYGEVVEVLAQRVPAYEACAELILNATWTTEDLADVVDAYMATRDCL